MPHLERIWIKRRRRAPTEAVARATLIAGSGIDGNADRGGRRQVTILSAERWREFMAALGAEIDPGARRANLLVSGIDLAESRGRILSIGPCEFRVRGETRPCERMDEALLLIPRPESLLKPGKKANSPLRSFRKRHCR